MQTDWSRLGGQDAAAAYERHREEMVVHFVRLVQLDADYARHAVGVYQKAPGCPFPKIGEDVKARLNELAVDAPPPTKPTLSPPDKNGWRRRI